MLGSVYIATIACVVGLSLLSSLAHKAGRTGFGVSCVHGGTPIRQKQKDYILFFCVLPFVLETHALPKPDDVGPRMRGRVSGSRPPLR